MLWITRETAIPWPTAQSPRQCALEESINQTDQDTIRQDNIRVEISQSLNETGLLRYLTQWKTWQIERRVADIDQHGPCSTKAHTAASKRDSPLYVRINFPPREAAFLKEPHVSLMYDKQLVLVPLRWRLLHCPPISTANLYKNTEF